MLPKPVTLSLLLAADAVQVILALPYLRRRVPPTAGRGARSRAPRVHSDVWYEANARSARGVIATGAALAVVALVLALVPAVRSTAYFWACAALLLLDLAGVGLWRTATTRRVERRHRAEVRKRTPSREMPRLP